MWHYQNPGRTSDRETYGFRSFNASPKIEELKVLEDRLKDLIHDVKFRKHSNEFQEKLKRDRNMLNEDPRVYTKADKTSNYYRLSKRSKMII